MNAWLRIHPGRCHDWANRGSALANVRVRPRMTRITKDEFEELRRTAVCKPGE